MTMHVNNMLIDVAGSDHWSRDAQLPEAVEIVHGSSMKASFHLLIKMASYCFVRHSTLSTVIS